MFASRRWTRIALVSNLLGTLLLFYSFQATSSSFRLIKRSTSDISGVPSEYAICVEDYTLLSTDAHGSMILGSLGCPKNKDDRPAAVVNTEHPLFITFGFLLIVFGFICQFFAVPEPKTVSDLRREIRQLKAEQELQKVRQRSR